MGCYGVSRGSGFSPPLLLLDDLSAFQLTSAGAAVLCSPPVCQIAKTCAQVRVLCYLLCVSLLGSEPPSGGLVRKNRAKSKRGSSWWHLRPFRISFLRKQDGIHLLQ